MAKMSKLSGGYGPTLNETSNISLDKVSSKQTTAAKGGASPPRRR